MARQGLVDQLLKPPFVLGFECAGEVEALGDGVVDIQVSCDLLPGSLSPKFAWFAGTVYVLNVPMLHTLSIRSH